MGFIRLLFVATVAAVSVAAAGCAAEDPAASAASAASGRGGGRGGAGGAVPVTVAPVVTKAMPIEITVIGTAEAFSNVAIRSQITGQLEKVNFTEGDDVQQGQVLFTLDRRPLESALRKRRPISSAIPRGPRTRSSIPSARRSSQARHRTREQPTRRARKAALDATVSADRAALENANVQLQYATIEAPISGRTGALMVHERQPRARQRSDPARHHQPGHAGVCLVLSAGGNAGGPAALPGPRGASGGGDIANDPAARRHRPHHLHRQRGRPDHRHDRVKGTFANDDRRLWPGQFANVVVRLTPSRTRSSCRRWRCRPVSRARSCSWSNRTRPSRCGRSRSRASPAPRR